MRYALAMLMALVLGGSAMIQAASAADREGPQASFSTIIAQYGPSDPGSIAGPMTPWYHTPVIEHDRN